MMQHLAGAKIFRVDTGGASTTQISNGASQSKALQDFDCCPIAAE